MSSKATPVTALPVSGIADAPKPVAEPATKDIEIKIDMSGVPRGRMRAMIARSEFLNATKAQRENLARFNAAVNNRQSRRHG
jgi:hypothetical protein